MYNKLILLLLALVTAIFMFSCNGGGSGTYDPEITGIQPEEVPPGTSVIISGSGFSPEISGNTVTFDGEEAEVSSAGDSKLQAIVPEEASTGPVKVTIGGQSATGPTFSVKAEDPGIESVQPDSGVTGTKVVITGMNFSATLSKKNHFKWG